MVVTVVSGGRSIFPYEIIFPFDRTFDLGVSNRIEHGYLLEALKDLEALGAGGEGGRGEGETRKTNFPHTQHPNPNPTLHTPLPNERHYANYR